MGEGSKLLLPAGRTSVVLVRTQMSPPGQCAGYLVSTRPDAIAARLSAIEPPLEPSEVVVLLQGEVGDRQIARARFMAAQGDLVALQLVTPFQPFDARCAARVTANLAVEVRSALGNSRQPGLMKDLSTGGAAVTVAARPGGRAIELRITANGYAASLPCEMVDASEDDHGATLHLSYGELSGSQRAFIRHLVASIMSATQDEALAS